MGPTSGRNATSPLHSRGSPKTWGTKAELVGPTSVRKRYIAPAFSGIPKDMGNKIRIGEAHKWAETRRHPWILGDPQRHGGQNQDWRGPEVGGNAISPLHSGGSPTTWGTKSELVGPTSGRKCYVTPAFSGIPRDMRDKIRIGGAHKCAETLHQPCILGDPQTRGEQNQNWWSPQVGGNATSPLHSRGSPKTWGRNENWWGPQVGGNATSPLHSGGYPKTWGTKSELVQPTSEWKCYITPAFSGIPKDMGDKIRIGGAHKWAKHYIAPAFSGIPKDMRDKIRIGGAHKWAKRDITHAFSGIPKDMGNKYRISGAHKWAEKLHRPCILGDPQRHGGQTQNW